MNTFENIAADLKATIAAQLAGKSVSPRTVELNQMALECFKPFYSETVIDLDGFAFTSKELAEKDLLRDSRVEDGVIYPLEDTSDDIIAEALAGVKEMLSFMTPADSAVIAVIAVFTVNGMLELPVAA